MNKETPTVGLNIILKYKEKTYKKINFVFFLLNKLITQIKT